LQNPQTSASVFEIFDFLCVTSEVITKNVLEHRLIEDTRDSFCGNEAIGALAMKKEPLDIQPSYDALA